MRSATALGTTSSSVVTRSTGWLASSHAQPVLPRGRYLEGTQPCCDARRCEETNGICAGRVPLGGRVDHGGDL
jgi:hypothetical protein